VGNIQEWAGFTTRRGAQKLIERLIKIGILELRDQHVKYGRIYVYRKYLDIFEMSLI